MNPTEMIVMIAIVSAMALSFIHVLRLIAIAIRHKTVRKAIEREPANAETLIAQLGEPEPERGGDDRLATVLIAVGIAMIAASIVIGDPGWMHYGIAAALFPLIVGTALWLRLVLLERAERRDAKQ